MSADQLLSKALSTDSEDEAIACLRMARKKGLKIDAIAPPVNKNMATEAQTKAMLAMINEYRHKSTQYEKLFVDYKRRWSEECHEVKKLQDELKNVPVKIVFTIAAVSSIVTLFWLLVGIAA